MPLFAVFRRPGPAWDGSCGMREQSGWQEHAAFMDELAAGGFVVLGGPLGDEAVGWPGTGTVLLIVRADDAEAVRSRLAEDPWVPTGLLELTRVEQWNVLLGESPR